LGSTTASPSKGLPSLRICMVIALATPCSGRAVGWRSTMAVLAASSEEARNCLRDYQ
jgi:hypothetical protein